MSHLTGQPDPAGSLNSSITGTSPFLGGENPPSYQPVDPTWQPNQYYRGSAQPAPPVQAPAPGNAPTYGAPPVYGGQPGYGPQSGYGSQPGYGAVPAYAAGHQNSQPFTPPPATNALALVALVVACFASLVGVVLGHVALNQIKRTGQSGRGLAIAALVVGYVQIVLVVAVVGVIIILAA